jgi:hypothetical protein
MHFLLLCFYALLCFCIAYLNEVFIGKSVTLKDLGVSLRHEKSELGYELVIFIDGKGL